MYGPDAAGAQDLLRNADLAMYAAKAAGKNRVETFRAELLDDIRQHFDVREDLRHAIERGELSLAYQPLVGIAGQALVGVEALLRWTHPEHGPISPADFIPTAEQTGLIVEIGRWALRCALSDLAGWSARAPALRVSVNVSARELAEDDYVDAVRGALADSVVEPHRVTLELTETAVLDDGEEMARRLEALRALGVRLAVDDFGTGYSSLSALRRFPFTQVKIDRSFLAGADGHNHDAQLVRSMIELGHALGLQIVAEGIERAAQLELLRSTTCELGQGYLLARPQPAADIERLLGDAADRADEARIGFSAE
jgi:EAL domain-containing protein (putative c-di-GMP-specific phosphodiesterase class I)